MSPMILALSVSNRRNPTNNQQTKPPEPNKNPISKKEWMCELPLYYFIIYIYSSRTQHRELRTSYASISYIQKYHITGIRVKLLCTHVLATIREVYIDVSKTTRPAGPQRGWTNERINPLEGTSTTVTILYKISQPASIGTVRTQYGTGTGTHGSVSGAKARQLSSLYCASTALLLVLENAHTRMVQHNKHTYDTVRAWGKSHGHHRGANISRSQATNTERMCAWYEPHHCLQIKHQWCGSKTFEFLFPSLSLASPYFNHIPYRTVPCSTFNLQLWLLRDPCKEKRE